MYIKLLEDKSLIVTIPSILYQNEANADEIIFLVPQNYEGIALAECTVRADF